MFADEEALYFDKPQMRYMNRLYNANNGENAYNANYTLAQVWWSKTTIADPTPSQGQADVTVKAATDAFTTAGGVIIDVPVLLGEDGKPVTTAGGTERHDPSKILFTNNPNYTEKNDNGSTSGLTDGKPTEINGKWVVPVTDGCQVRFVFDATQDDFNTADSDNVSDINFFDYDITDGSVYESQRDAGNRSNPRPTSEQQDIQKKTGTSWANTLEQGINSASNYAKNDNGNITGTRLAFGNRNTGTGLGTLVWKNNTLNAYNNNNKNAEGATFGLVQGLNSDGTLKWANGVNAPALFSTSTKSDGTKADTSIKGKTNYVNNEYSLKFSRDGGTYTLSAVNGTETNNLDTFGLTEGKVWSNDFWPMDYAPSYGSDGHDLKFGESQTEGVYSVITNGVSHGNVSKKNQFYLDSNDNNGNVNGALNKVGLKNCFPISDDTLNHNSYFGMNFSVDFTVEPGYVAPLRYFFYGDDDMFVFLSKVDSEGNESDPKLIADIGGVHSSLGMYVNLWKYVDQIPYEKDGKPSESQKYRLRFFYTERGASGSTCYMRFSVPFQSLTNDPLEFSGQLQVEKEYMTTDILTEAEKDKEYTFRLELANAPEVEGETSFNDLAPLVNRYQYKKYQITEGQEKDPSKDKEIDSDKKLYIENK